MKKIIPLFLIALIATFFRFYQLGNIPSGLTNDEANIGYDAFSILRTGRDQWNESFPLQGFKGFGDYRSPLYTYLVVPSIAVFGLTEFAVRFPSALFGVVNVVCIFYLSSFLFGKRVGYISGLLFALSPWSIGLSRVGIESNVAITLLLIGIILFIHNRKSSIYFYIAALSLSISVYMYSAYILFVPLVWIFISVIFFKKISSRKHIFLSTCMVILLCLPVVIKNDSSGKVRFSQIGIIQNIDSLGLMDNLNAARGSCIAVYPNFICKIVNNKPIVFGAKLIKNYISHFSFNFLYEDGTKTQYSILPERGLFFLFELPLFIIGVYFVIKNKIKYAEFLIGLLLISPIPDSLTGPGHYSRASMMIPWLIITESLGLFFFVEFIEKIRLILLKRFIYAALCSIGVFSLFAFYISYLTYFKDHYSSYSQYGYKELMSYIEVHKNTYNRIYISNHFNDTKQYIFYLFYSGYNPTIYQAKKDVIYAQDGKGWIFVKKIDNIYFITTISDIPEIIKKNNQKVLLVSHPSDFPQNVKTQKVIKDKFEYPLFKLVDYFDLLK